MNGSQPPKAAFHIDIAEVRTAAFIRRRGPWRSFEAVEVATLSSVERFNNRRLFEPIGSIPPAEAEERYCAKLKEPVMAA